MSSVRRRVRLKDISQQGLHCGQSEICLPVGQHGFLGLLAEGYYTGYEMGVAHGHLRKTQCQQRDLSCSPACLLTSFTAESFGADLPSIAPNPVLAAASAIRLTLSTCESICFWNNGHMPSFRRSIVDSRGVHPRSSSSARTASLRRIMVNSGIVGGGAIGSVTDL